MNIKLLAFTLLCATPLAAQQTAQPDFRWEKALAAGSNVRLHNLNGNVTVSPSTSDKVEVVGVKRGNSRYFGDVTLEVVESANGIVVCSMFRRADMECGEDGFRVHDGGRDRRDRDFDDASIDIVVKLPKSMTVSANSVSGDVTVTGAEGSVRAGSVSGHVEMLRLRASSVRASSVSGDVHVSIDALTGDGDLRFTSVSGDVTAELPKAIDADVTMRSVSGSLDTEFPLTLNGRMSRHSMEARIGKGGRELRVTTVSGDVTLRAAKQ
jgi:DUF4097 and DUF4098 domain-containing protein YvlB